MVVAMLNPTVKKTSVLLSEFLFTEKGRVWENYLDFVNSLHYNSLIENNKYNKIIKIKANFDECLLTCKLLLTFLNRNVYLGERVRFK